MKEFIRKTLNIVVLILAICVFCIGVCAVTDALIEYLGFPSSMAVILLCLVLSVISVCLDRKAISTTDDEDDEDLSKLREELEESKRREAVARMIIVGQRTEIAELRKLKVVRRAKRPAGEIIIPSNMIVKSGVRKGAPETE